MITQADAPSLRDSMASRLSGGSLLTILGDIEYCQDCGAPVESWSNLVVFPALNQATKLSKSENSARILNVWV